METDLRYRAFISYSHADEAWAKWLHQSLERYAVPARLRRLKGNDERPLPRRLLPVFRDRDELPSAAELGAVIQAALRDSEALIVICSPRAARSRWVNEEIRTFKAQGRAQKVFALIVDGQPHAVDAAEECFPAAITQAFDTEGHLIPLRVEPIAADARASGDGRRKALLKIIAGLLGVGFDDLVQRERQRQFWQRLQWAAGVAALVAVAGWAWQGFERYKQDRAVAQRIETVYERGRLALLAQSPARAAVYLGEAHRLGHDTPALRFMLARALETVSATRRLPPAAPGFIQRPAFSADGALFVTPVVGEGGTQALVRDAKSGAVLQRLQGVPAYPHALRVLAGGLRVLATGYAESSNYGQRGPETVLWDVASGQQLLRVTGHGGHFGTALSPDARLLLTAGGELTDVQLREITTGGVLRTLPHVAAVAAASFDRTGRTVLTGDAEGVLRRWDAATGQLLQTFAGRTPTAITGLLASPDGRRVIAASRKGDIRIWSLASGELQLAFSADQSYVSDMKLDAAGLRLLTVGRQGYKVWDLERGVLLFARDVKLDWVASGDLDASGRFVAIATTDEPRAELWDVLSRRRIADLTFEPLSVSAAAFNPQGSALLLTGETGNTALVAPLPVAALDLRQPPALYGAQFAGRSGRLVTAGFDRQLGVWDGASGARLASGVGHDARLVQVVSTRDGTRALSAADDGTVKLWRVSDGALLASTAVPGPTRRLLLSPDDQQLLLLPYAATAEDGLVLRIDATTGEKLPSLQHPAPVLAAAFSPDGSSLWTGSEDGVLRQWSRADGQPQRRIDLGALRFTALRFGSDPQRLLVVDQTRGAQVLHLPSGRSESRLQLAQGDEPNSAGGVVVSPDGCCWALITTGGEIWWQPVGGGRWRVIPQRGHRPWELRYLSGGLLVSSDWDGALHVWDSARAEPIAVLGAHDQVAWTMDIDPAGTRLLSASLDGSARVWPVHDRLPPAAAVQRLLQCQVPLQLADELQLRSVAASVCE